MLEMMKNQNISELIVLNVLIFPNALRWYFNKMAYIQKKNLFWQNYMLKLEMV